MLHVFHIDAGRMLTYDIAFAADTVATLQEALSSTVHAPPNDQILLISGGEVLDNPERRVSRYSAGTDSNPIFLVCRPAGDFNRSAYGLTCSPTPDLANTAEIESQIQHASHATPSFQTIQLCVQHAGRLVQAADANVERCAQLVYDQHLLHQGWLAVIANLDDTVSAFRQRLVKFRDKTERFAAQRQRAIDLLASFDSDVQLLKKIPVLPCLLSDCSQQQSKMNNSSAATAAAAAANMSLFEWVSSKEPEHSLHDLANDAKQALDRLLDPRVLEHLATLEGATLDRAQDVSMKEIGGLGKRLARLDEYLQYVKKLQLEQRQYADSLRAQEQKVAAVNDASIISDLCLSHLSAMKKLIDRQKQLADVTRRFCDAKTELLKNIHIRMQWVAETHQLIQTGDSKVVLNSERLHRLRRQLELLKQLHDAPFVYASAVTEVVRRKAFSREFIDWADRLTEKSKELFADENRLRQIFSEKFDQHFLRTLFPGLEERTPEFANEPPEPFDVNLPPIEVDHVRELRCAVPQLQNLLFVQKPNVYERVSISSTTATTTTKQQQQQQQSSAPMLQREISFFSQTPPKYASSAVAAVAVAGQTGSAPVIIRKSPSWFAEDDLDFSPTGGAGRGAISGGGGGGDGIFLATSTPLEVGNSSATARRDEEEEEDVAENTMTTTSRRRTGGGAGYADSDSEPEPSIPLEAPHESISTRRNTRSAPIRIPTNQRNAADDAPVAAPAMSPSGKFVTPDELMSTFDDHHQQQRKKSTAAEKFSSAAPAPVTTVVAWTQCSTTNLASSSNELESIRRDLAEKAQRLVEALECEQTLRRQLCDRDSELERYRAVLSGKILPELAELRKFFVEMKRAFDELVSENEQSKLASMIALDRAARQLEENLQAALEETRWAEEELRMRELDTSLEELRRQLENERNTAKECERQLANNEAYLKQKDDVIELMQKRLQDQESACEKQVDEAKSELMKRLLIEQELTADNVRVEYEREIEIKETLIQQLKQELVEKQQVLRDMKREQDKLFANICDREVVCDFVSTNTSSSMAAAAAASSPTNSDQQRNDEFEERLRQIKSDLEREYKDKLQMLTAGLEAKHGQQLERVRKEKEVELRMLKLQLDKERTTTTTMTDAMTGTPTDASVSTRLDAWRSPTTTDRSDAVMEYSIYHAATASTIVLAHDEDGIEAEKDSDECAGGVVMENDEDEADNDNDEQPSSPQKQQQSPKKKGAAAAAIGSPETTTGKDAKSGITYQTRGVQTKPLNTRISILRIVKGDLVLLVFDPQLKTFVVFTVSPTLYILKNSCLQRMGCSERNTNGQTAGAFTPTSAAVAGVATEAGAGESAAAGATASGASVFPKQRWVLGRVTELDYCQIKKPSNRYGLPMDTRFYRVSTEPVTFKQQS